MEMVNKGKKIVIALIVTVLLVSIIIGVSVSSLYAVGGQADVASYKLIQSLVRWILTAILMFFLYKGHSWAKWLFIVLFGLAALIVLLSLNAGFNVILVAVGTIYAFFCVMLICSQSVKAFLQYQKDERK